MLQGDDVDLGLLPVQRCWPGDPAPFITLPAVITTDPRTGGRNVGMYRMQVDRPERRRSCTGRSTRTAAPTGSPTDGRIPVAVALGLDPITAYSASAPLPKHIDELMLAGFFRGEPVELVKGVTVDLEVPANAEIVLEGYIEKDEVGTEGPFGDHTGYYTPPEPFPVFHLTAMTMRRDAIYPSIVVGKPPQEDAWLGKATERIFLPAIRATVPEIVDYDLPVAGAFHNCCIVSIEKAFPGHAQKVMHAIWGLGMLSLTKCVVVVDAHVNVHDYEEVLFYAGANVDPGPRRHDRRGTTRPPRPRAATPVRRRKARDRRHRQAARRGRSTLAGGDRDEPGDPRARRPAVERVRHRSGSLGSGRRIR